MHRYFADRIYETRRRQQRREEIVNVIGWILGFIFMAVGFTMPLWIPR